MPAKPNIKYRINKFPIWISRGLTHITSHLPGLSRQTISTRLRHYNHTIYRGLLGGEVTTMSPSGRLFRLCCLCCLCVLVCLCVWGPLVLRGRSVEPEIVVQIELYRYGAVAWPHINTNTNAYMECAHFHSRRWSEASPRSWRGEKSVLSQVQLQEPVFISFLGQENHETCVFAHLGIIFSLLGVFL